MRQALIIESLKEDVRRRRIQHVQILMCTFNGRPAVKINYLDTERYRLAMREIISHYCESLELACEKKTTWIYYI